MNFLDNFKKKLIETAMKLPYQKDTGRIVTVYCDEAYKNKLENEITNTEIRNTFISDHKDLPYEMQMVGINVRFRIDSFYNEPKFKAAYYDKGDN